MVSPITKVTTVCTISIFKFCPLATKSSERTVIEPIRTDGRVREQLNLLLRELRFRAIWAAQR